MKQKRSSKILRFASPPWKFPAKLSKRPPIAKGDRIIILGCGTSTGAPILACDCVTCTSTDPRNHRTRASVVFESAGRRFLVDTSPDLRFQCLANKLHWIDAVLYTHPHSDHLHGINELRTFNFLMGTRLPIYGNAWALQEIRDSFRYIFEKTQEGGGKPSLEAKLITKTTTISGVRVIPLTLAHGDMPVLGYRIKDIAYITDCSYIPEETFRSLKDLDVLVLDCLRYTEHPTHLSVQKALEIAKRVKAKKTYFTHMGHELEYSAFLKSLPAGIFPAYDGLVIESGN